MTIVLKRANCRDAELIWKMQVEAFLDLHEKYKDTDTSPATGKALESAGLVTKIYGGDYLWNGTKV